VHHHVHYKLSSIFYFVFFRLCFYLFICFGAINPRTVKTFVFMLIEIEVDVFAKLTDIHKRDNLSSWLIQISICFMQTPSGQTFVP